MLLESYRSTKDPHKFLFVPHGEDLSKTLFPKELDEDFKDITPFKTLIVNHGDNLLGVNADSILKQMQKKGYATEIIKLSLFQKIMSKIAA